MTESADQAQTREIRIIRHTRARKVLSANDWRARTEAHAIESRLEELRASLREDVERQVREELADAFVQAAAFAERDSAKEQAKLIEAAVACAESLVQAELRTEPARIRELAASVLEQAREDGPVALVVHPSALTHFSDVTTLAVRADAALEVGDCIVEVRRGQFDGRLRTRAERLVRLLKGPERKRDD